MFTLIFSLLFSYNVDHLAGVKPELKELAQKAIGQPYKYGTVWSPRSKGADCSGFAKGFLEHLTGIAFPRTSRDFYNGGEPFTSAQDLKPLDVIVFTLDNKSSGRLHVAVYLGGDHDVFIHAPRTGKLIQTVSLAGSASGYWLPRISKIYKK